MFPFFFTNYELLNTINELLLSQLIYLLSFTDKEGEFVFGPLCPDRKYAIQIWANATKKIKICAKCHHEGKCLKGDKMDKCDCFIDGKPGKDECKDEKEDKEY